MTALAVLMPFSAKKSFTNSHDGEGCAALVKALEPDV
jgi:hypothetical protein